MADDPHRSRPFTFTPSLQSALSVRRADECRRMRRRAALRGLQLSKRSGSCSRCCGGGAAGTEALRGRHRRGGLGRVLRLNAEAGSRLDGEQLVRDRPGSGITAAAHALSIERAPSSGSDQRVPAAAAIAFTQQLKQPGAGHACRSRTRFGHSLSTAPRERDAAACWINVNVENGLHPELSVGVLGASRASYRDPPLHSTAWGMPHGW